MPTDKTTATTASASSEDKELKKTLDRFNESWQYAKDNWFEKWERDNKLYNNERAMPSYYGTTNTVVPMAFSVVETMVAEINNANIRFDFKTGNPLNKYDNAAVNGLITEWGDADDWDLKIEEGSRETFITGMVANMLSWENDHPHWEQFAMRDCIIDPAVRTPADLQKPGAYAGRRFFVRKGQLDSYQIVDTDPESPTYGEMKPRFKKITSEPVGSTMQPDDKTLKEMFENATLQGASDKLDEIIMIYDVDRVITVANRTQVIESRENEFKERRRQKLFEKYAEQYDVLEAEKRSKAEAWGIVPIFFLRNYRRTSLLYANGEIDSIAKELELLNDLTNMEADYIKRQLAPQKELSETYADWIDAINNDPDTVYPFNPGSLVPIPTPVLPANSFQNRLNIKNEIRETTALDQVAKGVGSSKDSTATEINAQLSQSGKRIQSKARVFEKDGMKWWGWILLNMIQLYVDEPMVVEVSGGTPMTKQEALEKYNIELPNGAAIFDPADFADVESVNVSLDVDVESNKSDRREAATNAYTVVIQDPTNNLDEAKRILYPLMFPELDQDDIDAIITPAPAQMLPEEAAMMGQDPMAAAMGGEPLPPELAGTEAPLPPEAAPLPPEGVPA